MKRIPTVKAVEAVFARPRGPHRSLAATIVRGQEPDMTYLAWFLAVVRAYPESQHDWARAIATARKVRLALHLAESLYREATSLSRRHR